MIECQFCREDATYSCEGFIGEDTFYCCSICAKDLGPAYEIFKMEEVA